MLPDKKHGLFDALFIGGNVGRRRRGQFRKLGDEFCPETAQVSFRGNLVAELLRNIGGDRIVDSVQHAFVLGIRFIEDHHLKQMKILDWQQKLCLQIAALVSKQEIRMKDK